MAQFITTIRTDMDSPLGQYTIGGKMFTQDNKANRINVELYKNKQKVNAEGEITGIVKRNDGKAVAFSGGIENGNAYVVLPETAYAIEGPIDILVRETIGDTKTVIAVCKAYVTKSADADYVTAGSTVVSIEELVEALDQLDPLIERMQAVDVETLSDFTSKIEDVDDALTRANSIAENSFVASVEGTTLCFDPVDTSSTAWATVGAPEDEQVQAAVTNWLDENVTGEGSVVVDGTLSISGAAADAKVTGDELTSLKSAIDEKFTTVIGTNLIDTTKAVAGVIRSNGTIATNGSYGSYATSDFIELIPNTNYVFGEFNDTGATLNPSQRKIYLLYNNKDEHDASTYISQLNVDSVTFNSGSHKYVRVSWVNTRYLPQLEIGTTISIPYKPYNATVYMETLLGEAGLNQIAATFPVTESVLKEKIDHHDSATDAVGVIQNNGVLNPTATSYKTSDFIAIKNGYTYKIEIVRKYCIYDEEKVLASSVDCQGSVYWEFTASIDGYIRFSYPASSNPPSVTSVYEGAFVYKIEETIDFSERQKEFISGMMSDPLDGKKWAVCGDSFTNGATSSTFSVGKYAGMRKVYPYYIGNRTGIEVLSFFGGGRTLAFPAEPGDFVNSLTCPSQSFYYQNIPSDVDYITIYLGINDEHHSSASSGGDGEDNTGIIPIGTVDDNTTATYLGAWNVVLTWLITNRPSAHIGIIVTNGIANKDQYRQGQIAIAEKYGIPYIDLNGDARTPAMIRTSNPDIASAVKTALINKWAVDPSNNTHPNDAAHEFESTCIENFLRSL